MGKSSFNTWKGRWAESRICTHLLGLGWTIVERNACFVGGELDLVARDPLGILVFVEVKSAWKTGTGRPQAQVHRTKQKCLWNAALRWISLHAIADQAMRFDVVSLQWNRGDIHIEHISDAFMGPSSTW